MSSDPNPPLEDPRLAWSDAGEPRSGRFGDVYFSADNGLEESRAVFLKGCGLPDAWRGRTRFIVGELGFGTGLNIVALLDLWRRTRADRATLHIFSVEAFPMSRADIERALSRWPEIAEIATLITPRLPPRTPGFHRVDLPEFGAALDLAYLDAADALAQWEGRADAWFLDGFAPAANPQMWSKAVLSLIARSSAPGARLGTFTVAGEVRRGLADEGFAVAKQPGFGAKRERLEATFPGAPEETITGTVAIIGGGIAGASLARAFRAHGCDCTLVDTDATRASDVPAALVTPRFDAAGGAIAQLFAQALERAVDLYRRETPEAVLSEGVLQLEFQGRDGARFDKIATQAFWPGEAVTRLASDAVSTRIGEPIATGALDLRNALAIDPKRVIATWLDGVRRIDAHVAAVERDGDAWVLRDAHGGALLHADIVCIAGGWGARDLLPQGLLTPTRGQATRFETSAAPPAFAWGGYLVPLPGGVLVGATHDRGDEATDVRAADDQRNLDSLARMTPVLARTLTDAPRQGWAAVRALTRDRLPMAGAFETGLFGLCGLGSRGFTAAPLLAEHVAALATRTPSPLPKTLGTLVAPARFGF
ncbi:MAG TPA: tRNA (5-methylaminomethyl-2-thiouridine)(34)-methyltransferase MnmD [Caulobacteraceae bacterium]|jgi:tRNA 5-methylaminomethyl-2-thiouridine biosynthesis bifunctional protein|nr:tRNA (5-methylaminomethyl-2-thiouridine)(34)-methyltransferase MnmD [Caulobacteraceae bacterium]